MIKELYPDMPVIIGGAQCIFLKERSLQYNPYADISVIGEGEKIVLDIIGFLEGRKDIKDIPGVLYREKNTIKSGKPPEVISDLDSLHFPARHLVDKYSYGRTNSLYLFKRNFASIITTRGCPFRCRFCAHYENVINGWSYRQRSAENVVRELEEIHEKFESVVIVDDNFLADKKRSFKIIDGFIEIGTNINIIIGGARVDSADRELYKKMKKANVKFMEFGIESGNQDTLDYYNKHITLDQIRKSINLAHEMNFITMGSFILGAPNETKEHIENTIKFACSLPLDIAQFRPLFYQRGSLLWMEAVNNKKISIDEDIVPTDKNRGLGNFTIDEISRYTSWAYRRFYMRPSYMLGQVGRAIKRRDFNLVKDGICFISSFR